MAISQSNYQQLDVLVKSTIHNNYGISSIVGLIERASCGLYNPHYTEEEKLISIVLHHLGVKGEPVRSF